MQQETASLINHFSHKQSCRALALFGMACLTGCLSPKTLEKVAMQNEVNIANYAANVNRLGAAFQKEVALHTELQLQSAREQVAKSLTAVRKDILVNDPNDPALSNPQKSWFTNLTQKSDVLREKLKEIGSDDRGLYSLAEKHGVTFDVAAERPGFSVTRVLQDAVKLDQLNNQIINETEPDVHQALLEKRNRLLNQYAIAQHQAELNRLYVAAMNDFLTALKEQAHIAGSNARAFVAYSKCQPQTDSVAGLLKDEELRQSILDIVASKDRAAAERLSGTFGKSDEVLTLIENLRGK